MLAGIVGLGAVLDARSNALALSDAKAFGAAAFLLCCWMAAEVWLNIRGARWRLAGGSDVRVRSLGVAPRLAVLGALLLLGISRLDDASPVPSGGLVQAPSIKHEGIPADPVMSPLQERLLEVLAQYQRRFAASKLVVDRKDGKLYFDDAPSKGAGLSVVADLYGTEAPKRQAEFERLVESMPPEYLRILPEARWDNPFVVSVTEQGMRYLRK